MAVAAPVEPTNPEPRRNRDHRRNIMNTNEERARRSRGGGLTSSWRSLMVAVISAAVLLAMAAPVSAEVTPPAADLSVQLDDLPDPVLLGGTYTYTLLVANGGPLPATSVSASLSVPGEARVVRAIVNSGPTCVLTPGPLGQTQVFCALGTVDQGFSAGVTVTVEPQNPGLITALAQVDASEEDPDTRNNTAVETTTVYLPNLAPVVDGDQYTTGEDQVLTVPVPGVLGNDRDPDGGVLTSVLVTPPAHGALVLSPDGSLSYNPSANYNGLDSFTYKARDAAGAESAPATVSLTVTPVDDAPVAVDDVATTDEDTPVVLAVVDNDTDVDNPNSDLRVLGVAGATSGVSKIIDDRRIEFAPASNQNSANQPAGFSFTYSVTDGTKGSEQVATVRITVRAVNDPPGAVADSYGVDEDTTLAVGAPGVLTNDSDVDGPSLGAVLVTGPASAAAFAFNDDGSFTYTPARDFHGTDSFSYKAVDGAGGESPARTVTLNVRRADDAPPTLSLPAPITVDATGSTGGAVVNFTASATDEQPLNPAVTCTPASGATFAIGTTTVTCSATDAAGNTGTGSFTVTVRDVLPPVLTLPAPITVDAVGTTGGAPVNFTASATDEQPLNPAVTCTPAPGATFAIGTTTVNCSATDAAGNTGTGSFTETVRDVLSPVLSLTASSVDAVGTTGQAPVTFTATAADDDRRAPSPPVACTPASGSVFAIGTATVSCSSTDLSGNTTSGSFTVTVRDVLPPVLALPAPIRIDAVGTTGAAPASFTATATDDDRRAPDRAVTCTPASGSTLAIGTNTVQCSATDLSGNIGTGSFTVEVVDILPPVVSVPATINQDATGPSGASVSFTATATDDDRRIPAPPVTCTSASGSTFAIGDTMVTCTATDSYGNVGRASFTVHVRGAAELFADAVAASRDVGPGNALLSAIERAEASFAAGNVAGSCKVLEDYLRLLQVYSGKQVAADLAAKLTADARRIQAVVGC
jgi:hypothetical protein